MTESIPPNRIPRIAMLRAEWEELSAEYNRVKANIINDLHDEGLSHSLTALADARIFKNNPDLWERLQKASKEFNVEETRIAHRMTVAQEIMSEAAKLSIERERQWREDLQEAKKQFNKEPTKGISRKGEHTDAPTGKETSE